MSRSHLNLVLGLCAIVLVSLVAWRLALRSERPPAPSDRSEYVLRDYELLALDEEGSESFTVTGPHLFREPGARSLLLEQPVFSFPGGEGRWTARSVTAWVSPGGEELQLRQDVDMIGPPGATGLRTRFRTDFLSVFPERDEAGTTDRVTVTHGESILRGTGLKVDMQAKRFQLLNDVEGRYAPSRR
ncbi:MAG TPA: LPS export ABC transporter periplasmic protein LptC [Arenimonas sp.]|nr:LPS export ABC transporter periplasmic protein LptC [Arenimonas sp.]